MNNLLEVKVRYNHGKRGNGNFFVNLKKDGETTVQKIEKIQENLKAIVRYYESTPKYLKGYLIDVNYNDIIAKSKRISELIKPSRKKTNDVVVGARFSDAPEGQENHIITYYVDEKTIEEMFDKLEEIKRFLLEQLNGKAVSGNFNETKEKKPDLNYEGYSLKKESIRNMIVDCSVIESISVPNVTTDIKKESFLLTFFQTEFSLLEILQALKIDQYRYPYAFYGKDTISVSWDLYQILQDKVPYMISMISSDLSQIKLETIDKSKQKYEQDIPNPSNEPTIGVIDNLFDEGVYFSEWVENTDYLDEFESISRKHVSRDHGTEVSSIIVDGPSLNPWLDDGCGRFKVRHFGVCVDRISVPKLVNKIKNIVNDNPDIHVWNLSLGTDDEVSKNFISYDGSALDELQASKNIIFVVSGTNDNRNRKADMLRVGSPADSLNAVVVNSVKRNGTPASYTRQGTILSFFNKPDVSYYGGDYEDAERIRVCSSKDIEEVYGTSFAAPWIARKLSFLIDIMGFSREVAKALIIDSAAGWEFKTSTYKIQNQIGYGVVPIKISDILKSDNREIKFVLYGTSSSYITSNYSIPVPRDSDNKYPFIARATLCYFPECSRAQGVDYTSRELSLRFGRVNEKGEIDDINENIQDKAGYAVDERKSRKEFRKWENTKFISKILRRNKALRSYDERLWGISVVSKERLTTSTTSNLNFGVVITLREINGVNRIQDFIMSCTLRGWIVNEINAENRLMLYNKNQEEITFDEL
ncbi:MAG: S8 family peptidase [Firmicutes bacterium]|nr:S8 family peptidase [Bacillota bacterium]